MTNGWRVGVDTGGTFTDLIAVSSVGEVRLCKVASTPANPATAVFDALNRSRLTLDEEVDYLVLGTTIATNAVLTRQGARTIFVTTAGFEDLLYIQRIDRRGTYDLQWVKSEPYARRRDTVGVDERILADGSVRGPLTDGEIDRVVERVALLAHGASGDEVAVAVCLLFSYVNADHEVRLAAAIRRALPGIPVSVSSELAPVWREYERSSTTVIDAYVRPIVAGFASSLQAGLESRSVSGWHALMKSNGGQVPLAHASDRAIDLVLSGLAGGMIAGAFWARQIGSRHAVTLDMGGTSADVGVVVDGQLRLSGLYEVEWGIPVSLPIIDVTTIGAGGSSIASIDYGGLLRVGPESAGADPGPASYGRGGVAPTVTDANVVLGRLDPDYFLGGELPLDVDRAHSAIATLAPPLGLDIPRAAEAVLSVAIENMTGAVRLVTVDRGFDYRDFDLVAFGGAGPLHAAEIAGRMGMRRVIVPPSPGLVSAFGALIADERVDLRATLVRRLDRPEARDLVPELSRLAREARDGLLLQSRSADNVVLVTTYIACRYIGQNYEQEVRMYSGHVDRSFELAIGLSPDDPDLIQRLTAGFHALHRDRYGYDLPDQPIQSVYLGATALVAATAVLAAPYGAGGSRERVDDEGGITRDVWAAGRWESSRIAWRGNLPVGTAVEGPAIIEEPNSTTYVPTGWTARVDPTWCLVVARAAEPAEGSS